MSKVDNISNISLAQQVRDLPLDVVEELKALYKSGGITMGMVLKMLQDRGLIADGVKYHTFYWAMAKHGFKRQEYESHGFLADSEEHMKLWDFDKNQEENLDPEELTLKSNKSAWFKCPAGKHPSEKRAIFNHTFGYGCSKCRYEAHAEALAVPKKGRSLLEMYPLVAAEYEAGGNEIPASDVAARSNKVIGEFIPSCGNHLHRPYKQKVTDRTRNEDNWIKDGNSGSWCPWCRNSMMSEFHAEVTEFISSLIPLESGADVLVNQMVLPDDPSLPEGTRQGNEVDFLSWDLKLGIEIHGYSHDRDPEGYTESKKKRAEALGFDFFVIWIRDWENPEKREYLKEQLRAIASFKVMDFMKSQSRAVSSSFWNGDAE